MSRAVVQHATRDQVHVPASTKSGRYCGPEGCSGIVAARELRNTRVFLIELFRGRKKTSMFFQSPFSNSFLACVGISSRVAPTQRVNTLHLLLKVGK